MQIVDVEIDHRKETHVTRHGISLAEIVQVFANDPDVRRNRADRAGTHVAHARTNGGRRVLIPFVDKGDGRVRLIAAWEVGK